MKDILSTLKEFYSWETTSVRDRILEVITKIWITGLFLLAVGGLSTILVATIMNPHMWDNVSFGIYDTLGY